MAHLIRFGTLAAGVLLTSIVTVGGMPAGLALGRLPAIDQAKPIPVTVTTSPAGMVVSVDGVAAVSPRTFMWAPGSVHAIATASPQSLGAMLHVWSSWSDKRAIAHTVTTDPAVTTFTATFATAAARPGPARYAVELVFEALRGLASGAGGDCPGAVRGSDVLIGEVEGNEVRPEDGLIEYTGTLTRTTRIGHCEAWRPAGSSEDAWCPPVLTGVQNRVDAVISVWLASENRDEAQVELRPRQTVGDEAIVSGACTSDMRAEMLEAYAEDSESFGIEATDRRRLVNRLSVGVWQDMVTRPSNQPDGWALKVVRKIQ